ncbi:LuxR family transcriptional regulator [Paracoccus alkanivorans]|uniref:LuxR family transcriptional regulator n=2 Tax=Paracoccus alkanivorans TaxID=2116655 RepID=A0A3M0M3J5_9RHOB|nr:LuxR family transcriptional regulator [Paracoccus alkanivorans]
MTLVRSMLPANSTAEAIRILRGLLRVDHVTLHMLNNPTTGMDNPFVRTTYPESWVSRYLLNNMAVADPVLQRAQRGDEAFFWSELVLDDNQVRTMEEFVQAGLGTVGYSLVHIDPHGRKSVLSISRAEPEDWEAHIDAHLSGLEQAHMDLHIKALAEAAADAKGIPQLAPREYECLRFTAQGKTYSEIAIILNLSEHTVRSYLKLARVKLNCVSLAQAVAKAVRYKMI